MKVPRLLIAALFALLLTHLPAGARAPERPAMNLSTLKQQCRAYHDSGQYMADIQTVDTQAENYLVAHARVPHAAMVLDIDETSLSNWEEFKDLDFGYTSALFGAWMEQRKAPAIAPTLHLFKRAKQLHVAVFFITGRSEKFHEATVANLENAGYSQWNDLTMAPADYHRASLVPYKSGARKAIAQRGYHIIVNVGDQESDLTGGFADRGFKLPNPFYIVP